MTPPSTWSPRPDSVPDRAINWLRENGKTGHRVLSENIDAERMSMSALLKRSIEAGLIIQTHEQGEYHYDVPRLPASPAVETEPASPRHDGTELLAGAMREVTSAGARFPAATMEEALEEIASAAAAPTVDQVMASAAQHEEQASPPNGAAVFGDDIVSDIVDAARTDTSELAEELLEPVEGSYEQTIIQHNSLDDFSCAIYSDGRFVMVLGPTTIVLQEEVADALREYVRKHWPHDVHMGIQAALRGSM